MKRTIKKRKNKPKRVALPKPLGRKSLYDPLEHPRLARKLTAEGIPKYQMAEMFGVSRDTMTEWTSRHIEFSVAFDLGNEDAIDRVERALLDRATGYERDEEKLLVVSGEVERHKQATHYPADIAAAKFFLVNKRKVWKERSAVEVTGLDGLVAKLASARKRVDTKEDQSS